MFYFRKGLVNPVALCYFREMGLTIYKSSAGSGKTFTLVHKYLEKVLRYPTNFRHVLAITFTNKATEEMKTRIIRELDDLASGRKSQHLEALCTTLKLTETELRKKAGDVLQLILHDYSSFSVKTIDSYFQVLSRTLARELKLPVNYNIELDLDNVTKIISNNLLTEVGRDALVTDWLQQFLLDRLDNSKNWNILSDLKKITKQLLTQTAARDHAVNSNPEEVVVLITKLKKIKSEVENTMRSIGVEAVKEIEKGGFTVDDFFYKKSGFANYFYKISSRIVKKDNYDFGKRVLDAVEDSEIMVGDSSKTNTGLVQLAEQTLHPLLCAAVDYYTSNKKEYLTTCEVLKMIYHSGIIGSLNRKTKEYRDEFGLFLLSDTTQMLREMVRETDAPFIYEKSGTTFRHLFIDEFQDTGNDQWEILRPLVMNSMGEGNDVLIVGDAKQSIYRWRGGNMHLILDGVKKELKAFSSVTKELQLYKNYRSYGQIVNFNNLFFSHAAEAMSAMEFSDQELIAKAYGNDQIKQSIKEGFENGGFVSFTLFDGAKKNSNATRDDDNDEDVHWKDSALLKIDSIITDALSRGYHLCDVAILTRTTAHEQLVADYLFINNKYKFISNKSLLLSQNASVRFLLNCFRILIDDEENPILHYEINRFLDDIYGMNSEQKIPFAKDYIRKKDISWVQSKLLPAKKLLISLPVHLSFQTLLEHAGLQIADPFIDRYSDLILEYVEKKGTNVSDFVNWWDDNVESKKWTVEITGDTDAIRILSIHKSKGLQFPIVIIPFLDWKIVPNGKDVLWAHSDIPPFNSMDYLPLAPVKNLAETYFEETYKNECRENYLDNLNLLYVAFTRAENELYAFADKNANKTNVGYVVINALNAEPEWSAQLSENGELHIGAPVSREKKNEEEQIISLYTPIAQSPEKFPAYNLKKNNLTELRVRFESDEIKFGNQVHAVLYRMRKSEDLEKAVHQIAVKEGLANDETKIIQLRETVLKVWNLMEDRGWNDRDAQIECEPELCDENGKTHRPDRVVLKNDSAIVIDFKTGQPDKSHHDQVKEYCDLMKKTGSKNVEGFLVYTSKQQVEEVAIS